MYRIVLFFYAGLLASFAISTNSVAAERLDFNRDVRPILSDNCFRCHGFDKNTRQAELRLDTPEGALAEREGGVKPIVPGKPEESEVFRRITSTDEDERMPPADSHQVLTAAQIGTIKRWISDGAEYQPHWAFIAPVEAEVPRVQCSGIKVQNPIDAFIAARLESEGLSMSPEADRATLLRRVSLDLTGLPPTPEEVDAFSRDLSVDAYEIAVDRLLASPRYGERMTWDWLDAARYADTNGFQNDPTRTMWPWRDWVVQAFNNDMPYDQFTIEQLAGDLLPGATPEQRLATGFNRNHPHNGEGGRIAEETRVENAMDRAETTATVWLGVTMTCCRCHDHKYDPLSARDYYGFYAFFNKTTESGGGGSGTLPPFFPYQSPPARQRILAIEQRIAELATEIGPLEDALFPTTERAAPASPEAPPNINAALKCPRQERKASEWALLANHFKEPSPYATQLAAMNQAQRDLQAEMTALPVVMVMDEQTRPRETFVLLKGTYNKPGEKVTAATPMQLPALPAEAPRNRLSLSRWLVSAEHPLMARVTVNRYWQSYFGTGLVKTTEDFGSQGERPSHPELLDWLAVEFRESGWKVKAFQRLIVTSAAYRQSSRLTPALAERDPENRLVARGPRFRLPSWMLRDQALALGGLLVEERGGPPVRPYQPEGIWQEATFGKIRYVQDHGANLYRRSLYTFWRRIVAPTTFFDVANRQICSVKPVRTNTPLHALTTLNDVTYIEAARALAQHVMRLHSPSEDRVRSMFRRATLRAPRAEELAILTRRLDQLQEEFNRDPAAAKQLLSVGESPRDLQLNEAEHAALTALATMILNLDEVLCKQ